jgi:prepilin-type N-terminal cleavage/methylation domain-containing protein
MYGGSIMNTKNKKAFTLIELLVVVLIIGILAAIAIPKYQFAVEKTKAAQAFSILKILNNATETYHLTHGKYPDRNDWDALDITIPHISIDRQNILISKYFRINLMVNYHFVGNHIQSPLKNDIILTLLSSPYPENTKGKYTCRYHDGSSIHKKLCETICGTTDSSKFTAVNGTHYCWFNNWNI